MLCACVCDRRKRQTKVDPFETIRFVPMHASPPAQPPPLSHSPLYTHAHDSNENLNVCVRIFYKMKHQSSSRLFCFTGIIILSLFCICSFYAGLTGGLKRTGLTGTRIDGLCRYRGTGSATDPKVSNLDVQTGLSTT